TYYRAVTRTTQEESPEVQKISDEVKQLGAQIEAKRRELQDLEAKHRDLMTRLQKVRSAGAKWAQKLPPDSPQGPTGERRAADLERKLDRLLKEVEELRRELRPDGPRPRGATTPASPTGPSTPAPTPRSPAATPVPPEAPSSVNYVPVPAVPPAA